MAKSIHIQMTNPKKNSIDPRISRNGYSAAKGMVS